MNNLTRRFVLSGLIAAPAVVSADLLMPISSKLNWSLAWNNANSSYDVIFPSGYIKPEYEIWPELFDPIKISNEEFKQLAKYRRDDIFGLGLFKKLGDRLIVHGERIEKRRNMYPILSGVEKRTAYSEYLKISPTNIEKMYARKIA